MNTNKQIEDGGMRDEDLEEFKNFRESAALIIEAMKRRRFSSAARIRSRARFIYKWADLKIRVEESRRRFYCEMRRERDNQSKPMIAARKGGV